MGSIQNQGSPLPVGVQLREIAPAIQVGQFGAAFLPPVDQMFVTPGSIDQQPGPLTTPEQYWMIYTKSVLSWDIRVISAFGATLIVHLGAREDIAGNLQVWRWMPFSLTGEGMLNVASGIELPGDMYARMELVNAEPAIGHYISGMITVRGV